MGFRRWLLWLAVVQVLWGHGQLPGPRSTRHRIPANRDLVGGKVLPLAHHPQEQKLWLHPAHQQDLAATHGDHWKLFFSLLLHYWWAGLCFFYNFFKNRPNAGGLTLPLLSPGMICEQYVANGPMLHLYDFTEKHWEQLHIWQHTTMYLFFCLAAVVSLIVHTTKAVPVALDKLMLGIAFFVEGVFCVRLCGNN